MYHKGRRVNVLAYDLISWNLPTKSCLLAILSAGPTLKLSPWQELEAELQKLGPDDEDLPVQEQDQELHPYTTVNGSDVEGMDDGELEAFLSGVP